MRRGHDVRARGRHPLASDDAHPEHHLEHAEHHGAGESVEGHPARSTISAITSAAVRSLVSMTTASGAASSGRVARPSVASARSRSVERVAHVVDGHRACGGVLVALTARRPHLVARGDEHLERRVGQHHRADVAAFHHSPAVFPDPRPLPVDEHRAHRGMRRHLRDRARHLGPADRARHVATGELHATVFEHHGGGTRHRGHRLGVGEIDPRVHRRQRDRAVHRAGVERRQPERIGDPARHRRLAGARGPVDRDHPRRHQRPGSPGERGQILGELGIGAGDRTPVPHQRLPLARVGGDRAGHGDAVVAVAVELGGTRTAAPDGEPVVVGLDAHTETGEQIAHGRDPVALLHPELGGVADLGEALGERGGDRQRGDLVDHPGDLGPLDHGAVQRRGDDPHLAHRLAQLLAGGGQLDRRAHADRARRRTRSAWG